MARIEKPKGYFHPRSAVDDPKHHAHLRLYHNLPDLWRLTYGYPTMDSNGSYKRRTRPRRASRLRMPRAPFPPSQAALHQRNQHSGQKFTRFLHLLSSWLYESKAFIPTVSPSPEIMRTLNLPFRARPVYGKGIGALFSRLGGSLIKPLLRTALRSSKPLAKKLAKQLLNEGVNVATGTASNVMSGMNVKGAFKKNAKAGLARTKTRLKAGAKRKLNNVVEEGAKRIKRMQTGSGARRKKPSKTKRRKKTKSSKGKKKRTRRRPLPYRGIFN